MSVTREAKILFCVTCGVQLVLSVVAFILLGALPATACAANYDKLTGSIAIVMCLCAVLFGALGVAAPATHAHYETIPLANALAMVLLWGAAIGSYALAYVPCASAGGAAGNVSFLIGTINLFCLPGLIVANGLCLVERPASAGYDAPAHAPQATPTPAPAPAPVPAPLEVAADDDFQ